MAGVLILIDPLIATTVFQLSSSLASIAWRGTALYLGAAKRDGRRILEPRFERHSQSRDVCLLTLVTRCQRLNDHVFGATPASGRVDRLLLRLTLSHPSWVRNHPYLEHYRHVMARRPGHNVPSFCHRLFTRPMHWAHDLLNLLV